MKILSAAFLTAGLLAGGPCAPAAARLAAKSASKSIAGDWDGALAAGGRSLRLVLHLESKAGVLGGTMTSVDQGNAIMPLASAGLTGRNVVMTIARPVVSITGTLAANGKTIAAQFQQNGMSLPLTLTLRPGK